MNMNHILKYITCSLFFFLPFAAQAGDKPSVWSRFDTERLFLVGFFIFLLLIIVVQSKTLVAAVKVKRENEKRKKTESNKGISSLLLLLLGLGLSRSAMAQEEVVANVSEPSFLTTIPGDMITITILILFEVIVIMVLAKIQWDLLREEQPKVEVKKESRWAKFFQKVNNTVAVEEEARLDLDHDYDGIRELDNKIPKWWSLAFLGTFVIAVIYLFRMFVSGTLPDQITELGEANRIAAIQKAEYLRTSANNVDEHTVVMLDASGIAAGQRLYNEKGCKTCHGDAGGGNDVGPNLTDDYWLHKGSIKDIFYSIKYGWPEKGMIAWESQLSPVEMAQVASYIKSLKGSNPPNGKAPQGELYQEEGGPANDVRSAGTDTAENAETVTAGIHP